MQYLITLQHECRFILDIQFLPCRRKYNRSQGMTCCIKWQLLTLTTHHWIEPWTFLSFVFRCLLLISALFFEEGAEVPAQGTVSPKRLQIALITYPIIKSLFTAITFTALLPKFRQMHFSQNTIGQILQQYRWPPLPHQRQNGSLPSSPHANSPFP